ncbi:MAG: hypothetical protein OXF85_00135 [Candidatus Saccharibacteria bacterium]|nr:hypothetical protein [Candidatus Saccharibacteria bacterium]MCY4010620.1 hypothetical protein [Candidatus Saccharibacteria bacterium]
MPLKEHLTKESPEKNPDIPQPYPNLETLTKDFNIVAKPAVFAFHHNLYTLRGLEDGTQIGLISRMSGDMSIKTQHTINPDTSLQINKTWKDVRHSRLVHPNNTLLFSEGSLHHKFLKEMTIGSNGEFCRLSYGANHNLLNEITKNSDGQLEHKDYRKDGSIVKDFTINQGQYSLQRHGSSRHNNRLQEKIIMNKDGLFIFEDYNPYNNSLRFNIKIGQGKWVFTDFYKSRKRREQIVCYLDKDLIVWREYSASEQLIRRVQRDNLNKLMNLRMWDHNNKCIIDWNWQI